MVENKFHASTSALIMENVIVEGSDIHVVRRGLFRGGCSLTRTLRNYGSYVERGEDTANVVL